MSCVAGDSGCESGFDLLGPPDVSVREKRFSTIWSQARPQLAGPSRSFCILMNPKMVMFRGCWGRCAIAS